MKGFLSFRHFKRLLKIAAMAWALTVGGSAWGTDYTWKNTVTSGNWKDSANWTPSTGYPGQNSADTATFTGSSEITVTLDIDPNIDPNIDPDIVPDITVSGLNFNTAGSSKITLNLNSKKLACSGTLLLVDDLDPDYSGNVVLTGKGWIKTKTFDIPSGNAHVFQIEENSKLKITSNLWADGHGKLTFRGNGYLYLPTGGANVNNGYNGITELLYEIPASHRLPYEAEGEEVITPIYTCTIGTIPETFPSAPATVTFTGGGNVRFPYKVIITGSDKYQITESDTYQIISQEFNNSTGSFSAPGKKYKGGYRPPNQDPDPNDSILKGGENYNLTCTSGAITTPKNGITIIFYSPDGGDDPDKSFMEMGRISWHYQTPTWTGAVGDKKWTNKNNWSYTGITDFDPKALQDYSIEISETNTKKQPVIDEDVSVKELTISAGSTVTHISGKLSINKLITAGTSKFTSSGGIVEVKKFADSQDAPTFTADFPGFISINTLSIAEGASFTMPFDMSLTMLTINSGASFFKNNHNFSLGRLQVQTANYSGRRGTYKNITLEETLEADNIIILLRDGDITANQTLTARKDFIIGGASYNTASLPLGYEHFIKRPSESEGWVQSNTADLSLKIKDSDPLDTNSAFRLSANTELKAGTSGKGNFYICGANLYGDSSKNNLVIPQNDSPKNFCAEAINSTISNITVTCADGTSDGSQAQIPATGCSLTGCTNFDSEEFGISSANTVSDNRIYLKFPRPIRKITYPSAIKTSDGTGFTAEYASETGSDAPANPKSSLYLYTANTTWNTDASGTSAGSGSYTNSSGEYRTVIPYLVIPQYITDSSGKVTYGYVITDKWGKRLKSYSPDASAFKDVTDGIPEDKKTKRTPPEFSLSLSPVNNNQIVLGFSKPIITSSSKISYYIDSDNRISISQTMEELLPRCFEIVSIDPAGNAASADIQIDKNSRASISQSSTGLSTITLTLTRNITLSDIENLYIRLIAPKDDSGNLLYPITTYDHQTGKTGLAVSFIQESDKAHTKDGAIYMALNTAHSISDFAIGAINPSYAYNSGISDGGEDLASAYRNIYGEGSSAVHDFSKNQKNYGTISYGSEITLVSKSTSSINSLKLFITDDVDSDSFFKTFSSNFDKQSEAWLPNLTGKIFNYYSSALNSNFQTFNGEAIKSGASNQGFNTIIPKESVIKMKSGSQLSFVYTICDSSQNPLSHILSPIMTNSETGTYDLSKSVTYPLFALNLSNSSDLLSLSPWYITLKSITEQRGGVTILNNVINAAVGEKTVLKVNMPSSGNLDIMIMTIDGNIVKYLAHGNAGAGEHFYYWDGRNNAGSEVARGMYFVIVKAPGIDENRKVMVVK